MAATVEWQQSIAQLLRLEAVMERAARGMTDDNRKRLGELVRTYTGYELLPADDGSQRLRRVRKAASLSKHAVAWQVHRTVAARIAKGELSVSPALALRLLRDLRLRRRDVPEFLNITRLDAVLAELKETLRHAGYASAITTPEGLVWSPHITRLAQDRRAKECTAIRRAVAALARTPSAGAELQAHMQCWNYWVEQKGDLYASFLWDVKFHLGLLNLSRDGVFFVPTDEKDYAIDVNRLTNEQKGIYDNIQAQYELLETDMSANVYWRTADDVSGPTGDDQLEVEYTQDEERLALKLHEAIVEKLMAGDAEGAVLAMEYHFDWLW